MIVTTSPSELILNDDCSLAHDFKYTRRLEPNTSSRNPTLASGTAVSYVLEQYMQNHPGQKPSKDDVAALAGECLEAEFAGDEDGGVANTTKFLPGVGRAIARVPDWVWEAEWLVEQEIEGVFDDGELQVRLRGRPDMYRLFTSDEDVPSLEIMDAKTTDYKPLSFMLWTPQIRMYAAILKQTYPDRLISYRYLCSPTTNNSKPAPHTPPFVFTEKSHERTIADIFRLARKLSNPVEPRESRRCDWCEFGPICIARITGADVESFTAENYHERPTKEEVDEAKWESI